MPGLPPITIATVDTAQDLPVIALMLIVVAELHNYWHARQNSLSVGVWDSLGGAPVQFMSAPVPASVDPPG